MGCRVLDLLANATFLAQTVEGKLPGNVVLEMRGLAAWTENKMFVRGSFGNNGSDFVLSGSSQFALVARSIRVATHFGEDFFFLKLAQLGHCPLEVEARLFCNVGHAERDDCLGKSGELGPVARGCGVWRVRVVLQPTVQVRKSRGYLIDFSAGPAQVKTGIFLAHSKSLVPWRMLDRARCPRLHRDSSGLCLSPQPSKFRAMHVRRDLNVNKPTHRGAKLECSVVDVDSITM